MKKKKIRLVKADRSRREKADGVGGEKGNVFADYYGQMIFMNYSE
ncbi:MAG: hypothetical protein ACUVTU_04050 [Desulfurispora sp.]